MQNHIPETTPASQGLMEAGTWVTDTDACEVHWFLNHTVGKADVWWLFGDKKLIY